MEFPQECYHGRRNRLKPDTSQRRNLSQEEISQPELSDAWQERDCTVTTLQNCTDLWTSCKAENSCRAPEDGHGSHWTSLFIPLPSTAPLIKSPLFFSLRPLCLNCQLWAEAESRIRGWSGPVSDLNNSATHPSAGVIKSTVGQGGVWGLLPFLGLGLQLSSSR